MDNQNNSSLARWMLVLAFAIVLSLMSWFFSDVLNKQRNPNQHVEYASSVNGLPEVTLEQNRLGHYLANGKINGHDVEFMLDTGATDVAIPAALAKKMQLQAGPKVRVTTANGTILVTMTRLDRVDLGSISLSNIKATINPYMDESNEVLLGMSFLRKLEMIQRDKTLTLRQYQ